LEVAGGAGGGVVEIVEEFTAGGVAGGALGPVILKTPGKLTPPEDATDVSFPYLLLIA
jgi:hypothetical protein